MKRPLLLLSLLATLSTPAVAAKITTIEGIEQVEGIMTCVSPASAKKLAQAWAQGGYETADDYIVEHRDECASIPPRESLTYSLDLSTAQDGIAKFDAETLETSLWVPIQAVMTDLYGKFGQEQGTATELLDIQLFTPIDGLYVSRGVVDRKTDALQFVYLHGGQVHVLWYVQQTNKVLVMQEADNASYDPASKTLVMDQPGTRKRLTYTLPDMHEPLRFRTSDHPEMGTYMPTTSLDRFNNAMLVNAFPITLENPMGRALKLFTMMANPTLKP